MLGLKNRVLTFYQCDLHLVNNIKVSSEKYLLKVASRYYLVSQEVMFSLCLFVCLLTGLRINYSTDFLTVRWKSGTRAAEEPVRFWW